MTSSTVDKPWKKFTLYAAVMLLIYVAFCVFYNQEAWSGPRVNREVFTWIAAIGLGWLFLASHKQLSLLTKQSQESLQPFPLFRLLLGGALLFGVIALLTPNFHSTDVFGYINRGWQQWHYDTNPYVTVIRELPNWEHDPIITDHWVANPSPYGFLYMILARTLCGIGAFFAQGNKAFLVLLFKSINLLVLNGIALVIYRTLKQKQGERAALEGFFLLAWNPLLLIHTLMNGHNDILMGAAIAGAGCCALLGESSAEKKENLSGYWFWIIPLLMAATLLKYAALVVLPFAVIFLLRHKAFKTLLVSLVFSTGFFALISAPYLKDWQQFKLDAIQRNAQISHSSLHAFFYHLYKNISALVPTLKPYKFAVKSLLKNLLMGIYGLLMLRWFLNACGIVKKKLELAGRPILKPVNFDAQAFIAYATYAVGALVCLVTFKFYPWYLAMVYPMAILLPSQHWVKRLLTWLTVSHILSITLIGQAHVLNYMLMVIVPTALFWRKENNPFSRRERGSHDISFG